MTSGLRLVETGRTKLADVQRKMEKAARGEVKTQLRKALVNESKPLRREIVAAEKEYLPKGMQKKYVPMPALTFAVKGDVIEVGLRQRKTGSDMKSLNRGIIRHPLFGNKKFWFVKNINPGMWDIPLQVLGPRAIDAADRTIAAWAEGEFRG
ncbi:MAG TPA: hypothetical protein VN108_01150 [Marmoricola sp.]|nr:hypothetical protein [Marmoricola sp.]